MQLTQEKIEEIENQSLYDFVNENEWLIKQLLARLEKRKDEINTRLQMRKILNEEIQAQLDGNIKIYNKMTDKPEFFDGMFELFQNDR